MWKITLKTFIPLSRARMLFSKRLVTTPTPPKNKRKERNTTLCFISESIFLLKINRTLSNLWYVQLELVARWNFYVCSPGDMEGLLNYSEQNVNVSDLPKLKLPHLTLILVEFHCCLMHLMPQWLLCAHWCMIIRKIQSSLPFYLHWWSFTSL